jgi:hypothetical protein
MKKILIKKQIIEMKLILYQIELQSIVLFLNNIKTLIKNQECKKVVYSVQLIIKILINRISQTK